jgi:hypothetical protein
MSNNWLKNIVSYTGVASGALATLPHNLDIRGRGVVPDEVKLSNGEFTYVSADDTNLTVRNLGAVPGDCDALVEHWHTIERTFGPESTTELSPQPFVGAASGGGGGGGGVDHYAPPEKWAQGNVAANQTDVELGTLVSINFDRINMIKAGSIVGLGTKLTEAITDATADSLVATVTINGVAGTLAVSHSSGTNPTGGYATQAAAVDVFAAGDDLGIQITTLGSFAPTTTDLEAWLIVEV